MSQSESNNESKFQTTVGAELKNADVSSSDHALRQHYGDSEDAKKRKIDATAGAERFVELYEDAGAAFRELMANSETACVRRARLELEAMDESVPSDINELLAKAERVAGYEPLIEVTYRQKPSDTTLTVEDNGVGISVEEFEALQTMGYSTSHEEGSQLGNFGIGYLSSFLLAGVDGSFELTTRSMLDDATYRIAEYIANTEWLDGGRANYGTRIDFPAFCEKAKSIDVAGRVAHFAKGMRVTVLFREFDESGQETDASEEYLPSSLDDDYPDDALVVRVENEFFEAVMSPKSPGRSEYLTFNVTAPIRRNDGPSYSPAPSRGASWQWDFRSKREDGPIVHCPSDESLVGRVPLSDTKFDRMVAKSQDEYIGTNMVMDQIGDTVQGGQYGGREVLSMQDYYSLDAAVESGKVPRSTVPDDAIVMPTPSSSRDSFEKGHDDFWNYVGSRMEGEWEHHASRTMNTLKSWDDFTAMDSETRQTVTRAYKQFGPKTKQNELETINEALFDSIGVALTSEVASRLDSLGETVDRVYDSTSRADLVSNASSKTVRYILEDYDNVYMGRTISQKKYEIAKGLPGKNAVVRLDNGQSYSRFEETWGWTKLKDLPASKLAEKLPDLDSDVADKWENKSTRSSKSSSSTNRRTSRDPKTKRIKVRRGTGSRNYYTQKSAKKVYSALDSEDGIINTSHYNEHDGLIIFDQTNTSSVRQATRKIGYGDNFAVAVVPKYVYKYLKDATNIFESVDAYETEMERRFQKKCDAEKEKYSDYETILTYDNQVAKRFDSDDEIIAQAKDNGLTVNDSVYVEQNFSFNYINGDDFDGNIVGLNRGHSPVEDYVNVDFHKLDVEDAIPDYVDIDSREFRHLFGSMSHIDVDSQSFQYKLSLVEELGRLPNE